LQYAHLGPAGNRPERVEEEEEEEEEGEEAEEGRQILTRGENFIAVLNSNKARRGNQLKLLGIFSVIRPLGPVCD
jgi:hypothetical protein